MTMVDVFRGRADANLRRDNSKRRLSVLSTRLHRPTWNWWSAWWWAMLVPTLLGAVPPTVVHAGGPEAIVLRYQFFPGQRFAYRLTGVERQDTRRDGAASSSEYFAVDGVISYYIQDVSPAGVADASARIESAVVTQTVNGQSNILHTGPSEAAFSEQRVGLGPDNTLPGRRGGTLVSNSYGNYGLQIISALPSYPADAWTTLAVVSDR